MFFFRLDGATWMGFRSADLIGDLQTELHAYRLEFDDDGAFKTSTQQIKLPISGFEGASVSLFGPAPWHQAADVCE